MIMLVKSNTNWKKRKKDRVVWRSIRLRLLSGTFQARTPNDMNFTIGILKFCRIYRIKSDVN